MAGDWLKMELTLPDKPEVHYIANALNIDPDAVIGKLLRVWAWFDMHTENGNALGVTFALVDRLTCVSGFGEAMQFAGWLEQREKQLCMVNFDRHTSESAKKRALTAKRQVKFRNALVTQTVTLDASPREEKRRDKPIEQNLGEFEIFWAAYPKRKSRGTAEKAFFKINPDERLLSVILAAIDQAKSQEEWQKERGKYIPYPASWLNAKGWQDEKTLVSVIKKVAI